MEYDVEVRTLAPTHTAAVRERVAWAAIPETVGRAFGEVMAYLEAHDMTPTGVVYGRYVPLGDVVDVEAGFAVGERIDGEGRVQPRELPGGEAAVALHVGPYDTVAEAYAAVERWMNTNGRTAAGAAWEVYLTPPEEQPPKTEVVFPLASSS
jgi:effector-binding domain-containing protein